MAATTPDFDTLTVGDTIAERTVQLSRDALVRYAGASGDFNPIHWSERFANSVGLPGVIAHGMFTMALVGRAVTAWAGAPDAVVEFGVRFSRPVPVPDTDESTTATPSSRQARMLASACP